MVLGIIACITWLVPLVGVPVAITGLVLARKAQANHPAETPTGFVLNVIGLVLSVTVFILFFLGSLLGG